jgi:signal transduction histidine kinase
MVKIPFQILLLIAISNLLLACSSVNQTSDNKEVELLRKETELAKKEAELAKKELEMSKGNTANSNVNHATQLLSPTPRSTPEEIKDTTVSVRFVNDARACNVIKGNNYIENSKQNFYCKDG